MEKIRGRGWVGNIYHKFEAMCQEVDEFVTKDTVKYVENQVQTVGQNMKKLYSDVVQDFLIPMDNPVKREAQAVNGKQKYTVDTYTSSVTGTTQNLVTEQSSLDQDVDNCLESHNPSTSTELDGVVASQAVGNDLSVGNDSVTATCKSSDKFFQENIMREEHLVDEELNSPEDRGSSEFCSGKDSKITMCYSFSDDVRNFSDVSISQIILQDDIVGEEQPLAERSISFVDFLSDSPPRASEKNEKTFDGSPDADYCVSTVPSRQIVSQQNITRDVHPVTDQPNSFGDMDLLLPFSMEEGHGNSVTAMFPHSTSFVDTELGTFPEDERGCQKFSDAAESISGISITNTILQENIISEDQFAPKESCSARDKSLLQTPAFASDIRPISLSDAVVEVSMTMGNSCIDDVTCVSEKSSTVRAFEDAPSTFRSSALVVSQVLPENENVEVDIGVSNSSLLAQSSNLSTFSIGHCTEAESDSSISTSLSTSLSTPLASNENNVVTVIPSLTTGASLTNFSDVNASSSHNSVGNAECCPSPQLKELMCPTEIGCMNGCCSDLPGMETIDLTDKGNPEESCVLVDNKLHNAVSFRPRKYKSYKELLQEAFASRKRLIKEYKQLAVLYADVDAETTKHAEHSQFPVLPLPCLHSTESAICNICESEWELL